MRSWRWAALGFAALAIACGDEAPEIEPRIPRVKVYEVGEEASGQLRTLSGQLAAADRAPLSFGVGGTIDRVLVKQGDEVREGQLLATLDAQPVRISRDQARSRQTSARAQLVEAEQAYERAKTLSAEGILADADLEVATANVRSARAQLRSEEAAVEQAERDLGRVELRAPYAGRIAERNVEPFQEVGAVEPAFVVQGDNALKVQVVVPERMVQHLDYAQIVRVTFPSDERLEARGVVSQIAAQAGAGNAFPVEVQLQQAVDALRPGMSARVEFAFTEYLEGRQAYLIPISAIAIDAAASDAAPRATPGGTDEAPVYVLEGGKVELRRVRIGGLRGNQVEVYEGLAPGDQVVSAGVAFLRDGMDAERWVPHQGLGDG